MIYFQLFIEFCKVGLFTVGGGLAALPFLYDIAENFDWFTRTEVIDMIAISQSTPGPIGINMATFAGYNAAGVLGALIASISTTIPAFFIVITIAKMLRKFQESPLVQGAFYGLRPAVAALIGYAAWDIISLTLIDKTVPISQVADFFNLPAILLFAAIYYLLVKFNKHPVVYIALAAAVGIFIPMG